MIRCHKAQLDEALGEKIPSDHPIVAWLMIHCGVLYNISNVGSDGLTPFERGRGRRMGKPICMFGEQIWYKPVPVGRSKAAKMEPKFCDGLFLGLQAETAR